MSTKSTKQMAEELIEYGWYHSTDTAYTTWHDGNAKEVTTSMDYAEATKRAYEIMIEEQVVQTAMLDAQAIIMTLSSEAIDAGNLAEQKQNRIVELTMQVAKQGKMNINLSQENADLKKALRDVLTNCYQGEMPELGTDAYLLWQAGKIIEKALQAKAAPHEASSRVLIESGSIFQSPQFSKDDKVIYLGQTVTVISAELVNGIYVYSLEFIDGGVARGLVAESLLEALEAKS